MSVHKEIKHYNEFNALVTLKQDVLRSQNAIFYHLAAWIFGRKTCVKCLFSVILLSNLNLDHVRQYDVDVLCFPAKRGSNRSSADR